MFEKNNSLKVSAARTALAAALVTALLPGVSFAQGSGASGAGESSEALNLDRDVIHKTNYGNVNVLAAWRAFQIRRGLMPPATLGASGPRRAGTGAGWRQAAVPTTGNSRPSTTTTAGVSGFNALARTNIGLSSGKWALQGPFFMGPPGFQISTVKPLGPLESYLTGRANGVAYDPTDRSGSTAYVAAAGGGVWKTLDNGATWNSVGDSTFPVQKTTSIAVNPKNGRILFVGLGDFHDTSNGFGAGTGIMRSTNGGTTWVNIGINEMGGTAVSAIVVDPDNPLIVTATCGRGTKAGNIFRSVDGGNTFAAPAGTPTGDWSDLEIGAKVGTGIPAYYASRIGDGVYRSLDRGASWTKITNVAIPGTNRVNVDLVFNLQNQGGASLEVAASATDPNTVYVLDANALNNDARVYKSSDRGATWRGITGNLLIDAGQNNNWARANSGMLMKAFANSSSGTPQDLVFNGGRTLSGSLSFGLGEQDWTDIGRVLGIDSSRTHADQHDMSVNPANPNTFMVANAGGVYGLSYSNFDGSQDAGDWFFTLPGLRINGTLAITQFLTADFSRQDPMKMVGGTLNNGMAASFNPGSGSVVPDWTTLDIFASRRYIAPPNDFGPIGFAFEENGGAIAFDPANDNVQYAITPENAPGNGSPDLRVLYTQNNWSSTEDISPDTILYRRVNRFTLQDEVARDANNASPLYVYPTSPLTSSSLATDWKADRRLSTGIIAVSRFVDNTPGTGTGRRPMYTGGQYLWRYDNNTAETLPAPLTPPADPALGRWRSKIGNVQFTTAGSISAIAISENSGNVIYVGTTDGQVWVSFNALSFNVTTGASTATFTKISDTLPARPVTSISINPNPTQSGVANADIVVSLGGIAPGTEGHVYRAADVTARNVLFTKQDGVGVATLPNVAAVGIVRDPDDATNTWYLGTDVGVFTTINGGSSWSDASTPLGLPNVEISAIKVYKYPDATKRLNVATYGRGVWQFDVTGANEVTSPSALTISPAYSRTGGQIYVTLNVKNSGGTATNARVTAAALTVGTTTTTPTTALPLTLGTIGNNANKTATVAFPGSVGRLGTSAVLSATVTYTDASGAPQTFVYTAPRTRLP